MNKKLIALFVFGVASVTGTTYAQEVKGDALAGETKSAMCYGCHGIKGYHASFPEIHRVPKISGQSAKYIVSALTAYKKGERRHPSMKGVATTLSDQDMADLAAYYSGLGGGSKAADVLPTPSVEVAALLNKGACVSCHGANLSKPTDPSYPKIAGQHADYLYVALKAYKQEKGTVVGRANPIMGGVAKQFDTKELKLISNYLGSLDSDLETTTHGRFQK
jgi:cytochrome c553